MPLSNAPIQNDLNTGGRASQPWALFFTNVALLLGNTQPQQLPTYTVATLPTASTWTGYVIYVSDETGGATLAFSDGTNWRRVQDRNVVS